MVAVARRSFGTDEDLLIVPCMAEEDQEEGSPLRRAEAVADWKTASGIFQGDRLAEALLSRGVGQRQGAPLVTSQ